MKPFNLDEYNALVAEGKTPRLVTRDGHDVKMLCTNSKHPLYPIVVLIDIDGVEIPRSMTRDGKYMYDGDDEPLDLFFADPEPTYRPYRDAEECYKDVVKHGGWIKSKWGQEYFNIGCIGHGFVAMVASGDKTEKNGNVAEHFDKFLEDNVWADDNSPCGVKEEE